MDEMRTDMIAIINVPIQHLEKTSPYHRARLVWARGLFISGGAAITAGLSVLFFHSGACSVGWRPAFPRRDHIDSGDVSAARVGRTLPGQERRSRQADQTGVLPGRTAYRTRSSSGGRGGHGSSCILIRCPDQREVWKVEHALFPR